MTGCSLEPTALNNGQRSQHKLLASAVKKIVARLKRT
jgi:hypothetical protein